MAKIKIVIMMIFLCLKVMNNIFCKGFYFIVLGL